MAALADELASAGLAGWTGFVCAAGTTCFTLVEHSDSVAIVDINDFALDGELNIVLRNSRHYGEQQQG